MIARLIGWSARNLMLVFIGTVFAVAAGLYALAHLPLDAIPDLSDTQVIVYTEYGGQAPQVIEDQVTYPLTTAMLTVPKSKVVRGFSFFGVSFVYIIFEDGTDIYWARSRVLEYLNAAARKLPAGVTPALGPDATGVGWVYQYALQSKNMSLADLRSLQDWNIRYGIAKAEGVAEVASVGGFVKQYNVVVDPNRLRSLNIPLSKVRDVIRGSNMDVGGRTVELSEFEFIVRGRGYLKSIADLSNVVLKVDNGTPVLLKDVARIEFGPDERRGITELNGEGEVASGIALQRFGQNALDVIDNVKARFAEMAASLPSGVAIVPVYDRSNLIHDAIETLKKTLTEESIVVALVCVVFLLHVRSALVAILMLPVGILMAFAAMKALGLGSNIMSLGGIAIAIGAMIDAAIVMIENAHKHLERAPPDKPRIEILIEAASEVGPALFFSLLIITVSFLPIFTMEAQEGRLFSPLAFTKTFAMAAAAILSVTLVPALMVLFVRGRIVPEHKNPINRFLIWVYRPLIRVVLKAKTLTIVLALAVLAASIWPARQLGTEFMPSLNEGTLMYMPTTLPGISVTKTAELLQTQNRIIKTFPEVASVYGKAGRAETATDPAPTEMVETVVNLKPKEQWRAGLTVDGLIAELDKALQFPGVSNAWTMPIKARTDMLATGIRTPVGIKVLGTDLNELDRLARQIEAVVKTVPGTSSAYAERVIGGYYLDVDPGPRCAGPLRPDGQRCAGYGVVRARRRDDHHDGRGPRALRRQPALSARSAQRSAVDRARGSGGDARRRHGAAGRGRGRQAHARPDHHPHRERPTRGLHLRRYPGPRPRRICRRRQGGGRCQCPVPAGLLCRCGAASSNIWNVQRRKLQVVVPVTLLIIFLLLYLNFRRLTETLIVMLSLPFSLVGGLWLMWWLGFNFSVAVAVGFIALAGVAAETGVIMLIYLDQAMQELHARRQAEGAPFTAADLQEAIMLGAVERVRPKMMTVVAIMAGLLPIMWSSGTGSEVMQRIAVPMIGGMISSTVLTLMVIPAVYAWIKGWGLSPGAAPVFGHVTGEAR